jgi:predicted Ser/Thr protein kinase
MSCPRCDGPATTEALREFGGVCAKCLLEFAAERDAPAFPGLEIERVLGEGGMGVVYKAVQKQLGRTVALKVLSPALASDPSFVERFTREARALAQLSHPNIVAVHESGVHDGVPYLVMEYVEGTPLRKLLAAGKLTPERALEVVPQICDALAYAHAHGVVHRDVKPENILVDREGRVKIADFGLAKLATVDETRLTRTRMLMGTPNYMAPEQIENPSTVDHRADIYSLGVVFYEMLTGELPLGRFKAPSEKAAVDARLDPVVLRSLEKDPGDRYQQAGDVKDEVTRVRAGAPTAAPLPAPKEPSDLVRACKVILILALIALVLPVALPAPVGKIVQLVAGALFIATLALSVLTLGWLLWQRGRRRGMGTVLTAMIISLLALSTLFIFLTVPSAPARPAPAWTVAPPPVPAVPVRLAQVWPDAAELPSGLTFRSQHEGADALKAAKLPEELLADVDEARYAVLQPGDAEILALRFKTKPLEELWSAKPILEVSSSRWPRSSWNGDRIKIWVGHGKFDIMSASVVRLSEAVSTRLKDPRSAPARPRYSTFRPIAHKAPFSIAATWPTAEDLKGLAKERESRAGAALYEAGLPEAMLADLAEVRRCLFLEGGLELLGLEFKAEIPPRRNENRRPQGPLRPNHARRGRDRGDRVQVGIGPAEVGVGVAPGLRSEPARRHPRLRRTLDLPAQPRREACRLGGTPALPPDPRA